MTQQRNAIVVGVDGTPAGDEACRFAAREAQQRGSAVELIRAWQPYAFYASGLWAPVPPPFELEDLRQGAVTMLAHASAVVGEQAPDVEVQTRLVEGSTSAVLLNASSGASLVVVGGRDPQRHDPAWLGSVAGHVVTRAPCPAVVVPVGAPTTGGVVVGVDGSDVSGDAVEFAFDQAARWRSGLTAVLSAHPGLAGVVPTADALARMHELLRSELSEALAGWSDKYPDVPVTELVSLEPPLQALRAAAADARLLVVGSHGRGALLRFALGSVSAAVLRAARCAVAVVRPSAG